MKRSNNYLEGNLGITACHLLLLEDTLAGIFDDFNDHGFGKRDAFEKLCCQLFELYGKDKGLDTDWRFRDIRGDGGDGGIEAYWHNADCDEWIGIQAKWFPNTLGQNEYDQIKSSIHHAVEARANLHQYIVCIPHDLTSKKKVRENKYSHGEDEGWQSFVEERKKEYPELQLELWDEHRITSLLEHHESEGCLRFWFKTTEINPECFKLSLEKTTERLSERYKPKITDSGGMSEFLDGFFGLFNVSSG